VLLSTVVFETRPLIPYSLTGQQPCNQQRVNIYFFIPAISRNDEHDLLANGFFSRVAEQR